MKLTIEANKWEQLDSQYGRTTFAEWCALECKRINAGSKNAVAVVASSSAATCRIDRLDIAEQEGEE